jgi:hypothetical protein
MRSRALLVGMLVCLMLMTTTAQSYDVTVTWFNLSNTQSIRIASLYDDLDFFVELAHGRYDESYFEREHRFIHWCGEVWDTLAETFDFRIPDEPDADYLLRWHRIANRLDYDVVLVVAEALRSASNLLPGDDIQVCLVPAVPPTKKYGETEIYGASYDGGMILAIGTLRDDWELSIANVVAHEYDHAARLSDTNTSQQAPDTLLDRLIAEGKASSFARLVIPDYVHPTYDGLTLEEEQWMWHQIEPLLSVEDMEMHNRYMFGGQAGIPLNAGYTIGYRIVQAFIMNHPDMPVEEWINLPSQTIFDGSQYNP